jgi:hypothetical protein
VPIASGNLNGSLLALVDGKMLNLRVPIPKASSRNGWKVESTIRMRLEGPGIVATLFDAHDVSSRRRQGESPQGGQVSGASGPARSLRNADMKISVSKPVAAICGTVVLPFS